MAYRAVFTQVITYIAGRARGEGREGKGLSMDRLRGTDWPHKVAGCVVGQGDVSLCSSRGRKREDRALLLLVTRSRTSRHGGGGGNGLTTRACLCV